MNEKAQHLQAINTQSNLKNQLKLACERYKKDYYFTVNKYHGLAQAVSDLIFYIDEQIKEQEQSKSLFIRNVILALDKYLSDVQDKKFKKQIAFLIETNQNLFDELHKDNFKQINFDVVSNLVDAFSQLTKEKQSSQKSLIEIFEKYYALVCVKEPILKLYEEDTHYRGDRSLNELHTLFKENKFSENTQFTLYETVSHRQLNILVDHLIEHPISTSLTINLSCCNIKSEGAQVLARYLSSGKTPNNLMLWLFRNQIDNEGAGYLADAISSGKTSDNLSINLDQNPIDVSGIQLISDAIQSKKAMPGLFIRFDEDETRIFPDLSVKAVAESIQSKNAPNGLNLFLSNLSNTGVEYLATAIRSGNAPLNLSLQMNCINAAGMATLIQSIGSGNAPEGTSLTLWLSAVELNETLGEEVAKLIEHGKAPRRLNLSFLCPILNASPFVNQIIEALKKGNGPEGLTIDLELSRIDDNTKHKLLNLFASGKCPRGLELITSAWLIDDENFQKGLAALLMKDTSIIIDNKFDADENPDLQLIKFCSLRNKLIFDFPEFENFILNASMRAHLYTPTNTFINPSSLKISVAFSFINNKDDAVQTLPTEIIEFIKRLDAINEELNAYIPKIG